MKLIIDIPDTEYQMYKISCEHGIGSYAMERILDGKPLNDVLDKIRAEIEQKARPNEIGGRGNGKSIRYGLCIALEIIDKYRAESEDKG